MSLIFCDGCDDGLLSSKWPSTNNVTTVAARNGNGYRTAGSTTASANNRLQRQVAAADEHATFIFGTAVAFGATGQVTVGRGLMEFLSDAGATTHVTLRVNADGSITAIRGTIGGAALGTSPIGVIGSVAGTFYYVEAKVTLSDTVGVVTVKVNNAVVLNLTGIDTKNAGTKTVLDSVALGYMNNTTSTYDDIVLLNGAGSVNNDFIGDVAIETLYPNGNGSSSQFVGSDGNSTDNYLLVNETPPVTTSYVGSGTSGNKDLYTLDDLVRASGSIPGLIITALAADSDAVARNMKIDVKSGATTSAGADNALTTSYTAYRRPLDQNPVGAVAWTISSVNALEVGVEAGT